MLEALAFRAAGGWAEDFRRPEGKAAFPSGRFPRCEVKTAGGKKAASLSSE